MYLSGIFEQMLIDITDTTTDSEEDEDSSALHITEFSLPYLSSQTLDPINCIDGVQQNVSALLYEGLFVKAILPMPVCAELVARVRHPFPGIQRPHIMLAVHPLGFFPWE